MNWRVLTYGTAVMASLTLGTAIYYGGTRTSVKTEDLTELIEAVAERKLALTVAISTQSISWAEAQWTNVTPAASWDGTNLLNGYWSYDGTTNAVPTSYKGPAGTITRSNTFVSTGQWLRAWVPVYTNVGRLRDVPHVAYTVDCGDPYLSAFLDGSYSWTTSTWSGADVTHVWSKSSHYQLIYNAGDPDYGWQLIYWGWPILSTKRDSQYGGSICDTNWVDVDYELGERVVVTPSGSVLDGFTNITSQIVGTNTIYTTNITRILPLEFPARILTNVANAVGIHNQRAYIDDVDASISEMIGSYIDMSMETNGTFDGYFSANTNATAFPKLSLVRAVELLGSGVGTNIVYGGATNAYLLTTPPHGTNPPVYGGTALFVTTNMLTARFKVLQLMTATELTPNWWAGDIVRQDFTSNSAFYSNDPFSMTYIPGQTSGVWYVTNLAPRVTFYAGLFLSWIHYLPNSPTNWWHSPYWNTMVENYNTTLKIDHAFMSHASEISGYYKRTDTNLFFDVPDWTLSPSNAVSSKVVLAGGTAMNLSLSNAGAPYSVYNPLDGYTVDSSSTGVAYQARASAGPACIKWDFQRCKP